MISRQKSQIMSNFALTVGRSVAHINQWEESPGSTRHHAG